MATVVLHFLHCVGGWPWVALVVTMVLVLTYLASAALALFHPRPARRRDARYVLDRHFFTRRR